MMGDPRADNKAEVKNSTVPAKPHNTNYQKKKVKKHTTAGIRWWSPTQLLICRSEAYGRQSGRDAQFSSVCGRM
jgi:hypothetical protein